MSPGPGGIGHPWGWIAPTFGDYLHRPGGGGPRAPSLTSVASPVLVISGCSAVGKSTVSQLLRGALEPSLHIQSDVFCRFFDAPFPDPASAEGAHRYEVIGVAQAAAATQFAVGNYTVILDGTFLPQGADGLAEICGRRGVTVHYAVLRTELDTCLQRALGRDPTEPPDFERFHTLYSRFTDLGQRESHVIDASGSAEQVAETVAASFRSGRLAVRP